MSELVFSADVDPKDVSVNLHFRSARTIHPVVREGQKRIGEAAKHAAKVAGWEVPGGPLGIHLEFTFNDFRGDTDNPIKRTIDATMRSLKFDDSKIVEIFARRRWGKPGIWVKLYETTYPEGDPRATKRRSYNNKPEWDFEDE